MERFSTNLYHHSQPFWFYLPVALLALVPWTVFVVAALVDAIRDWRFSVQQPPGVEDLRTYLTVWLLLPIAFFSLSQSKLPGYILPAIPAGTILLANFVWRREQEGEKPSAWLGLLHALLSAAMLVAALVVPFKLLKLPLPGKVIIVAVALAVTAILSLWLSLRMQGYRVLRFVTLVPVVIAFALLLRGTAPIVNLLQSARPVEAAIHQSVLGQIPTIAVYDVPPGVRYGLAFYLNQPIASYEQNEIPAFDHLVVAASGAQKELEYRPARTQCHARRRLRTATPGFLCGVGKIVRTRETIDPHNLPVSTGLFKTQAELLKRARLKAVLCGASINRAEVK